jgi:hypothetical protein
MGFDINGTPVGKFIFQEFLIAATSLDDGWQPDKRNLIEIDMSGQMVFSLLLIKEIKSTETGNYQSV